MPLAVSSERLRHRFAVDPLFKRRFVFLVLGVFAAAGWGSLAFFSTLFTVRSVEIQRGRGIDAVSAKAAVFQALDQRPYWRPWSPRHAWFIEPNSLAERLKVQWYADSVEVQVEPFSHIVRLIVKEQTNSLFIKTPTKFLRVDTQGVIREELGLTERLQILQRMAGRADANVSSTEAIIELPLLTDDVAPGYRLTESIDDIRTWFDLGRILKQQGVVVRYLRVEPGRIVLFGQGETPVYLDPSQNVLAQIKGLQHYYAAQKKNKDAPPQEFIDARIPGRLYVK